MAESGTLAELLNDHVGAVAGEAYSEEELVRQVLAFIGAPTPDAFVRLMLRDSVPELNNAARELIPTTAFNQTYADYREHVSDESVFLETQEAREQVIADLEALRHDRLTAAAIARLARSAEQQAQLPRIQFDRHSGLQLRFVYVVDNVSAVLDYTVLLLADSTRPFRRDLCRCKLGTCRQFFLASRNTGGRSRRAYCRPEHMKEAHFAGAPERVRRSRARKEMRKREALVSRRSRRQK